MKVCGLNLRYEIFKSNVAETRYAYKYNQFQDLHIGLNQSSPPPYPPGNLNDSGSKESAIEPATEFPLAFGTALDPVQEPSITFEAAPTSTRTTIPKDSSPSCDLESMSPDVSITSPTQLQEQNEPSHASAKEINVTSLVQENESTHLAELDDDLKVMSQEFYEDIRDNLKNLKDVTCGRCEVNIAALDYHYSCVECETTTRLFICQKCYHGIENCRNHHKKYHKREFKPWHAKCGTFYIDTNVITEDNQLIRALKQNNIIRIRQYAQNRTLLDSQDKLGFTPLHVAAHLGLEEGTVLLIECGALFEFRNYLDHTPLHTAVSANQIKIIQILLDGGANIETTYGKHGSTALHLAAGYAMHHIVTLLLRRGAEIDAPGGALGNRLYRALQNPKCRKCVEALLAAGSNVNDKGSGNQKDPLIRACRIKDHETARIIVDLLLRYGAAVDLTSEGGYSPLMAAAERGHLGVCKSLLERSPQLDIQSKNGSNAIYHAARYGHEEILDLLIAEGASCLPPKLLLGKWKHLESYMHFPRGVTPASKKRILSKLRAAKHN
jgi:ankyrin repeat protein